MIQNNQIVECDRLIIDGVGRDIKASLKHIDGSDCLLGELIDDKEKYIAGVAIYEMAKTALSLGQSSTVINGINVAENSVRNHVLKGVVNTGNEASEMMKEEFNTKEPIVMVSKGTKVIIQFNQGISL